MNTLHTELLCEHFNSAFNFHGKLDELILDQYQNIHVYETKIYVQKISVILATFFFISTPVLPASKQSA